MQQNVTFTQRLMRKSIEYEESSESSKGSKPFESYFSKKSPNWLITMNIDLGEKGSYVLQGLHKEDPDVIAKRFQKTHNLGPRSLKKLQKMVREKIMAFTKYTKIERKDEMKWTDNQNLQKLCKIIITE